MALVLAAGGLDVPSREGDGGALRDRRSDYVIGASWTDGRCREVRQLKHRAGGEVRALPGPLVTLLRAHLERVCVPPIGRIFHARGASLAEQTHLGSKATTTASPLPVDALD